MYEMKNPNYFMYCTTKGPVPENLKSNECGIGRTSLSPGIHDAAWRLLPKMTTSTQSAVTQVVTVITWNGMIRVETAGPQCGTCQLNARTITRWCTSATFMFSWDERIAIPTTAPFTNTTYPGIRGRRTNRTLQRHTENFLRCPLAKGA